MWKVSKCGVFSGPCFPVFGHKTDWIRRFSPYSVRIQYSVRFRSEYGKIQTRKNSVFGLFPNIALVWKMNKRNVALISLGFKFKDGLHVPVIYDSELPCSYISSKKTYYFSAPPTWAKLHNNVISLIQCIWTKIWCFRIYVVCVLNYLRYETSNIISN